MTYAGSATPPSAIGSYAVLATVTDANHTGSASAILSIVAQDAADLSVSISNGRDFTQYGKLLTYVITVNNVGNVAVSAATVVNVLPPELEQATWSCMALGSATCTASGNGGINDTVGIPVGGGLLYMLTARVADGPVVVSDRIVYQVTVSATGDDNAANDTAIDTTDVVLFRNGFEMGGDGAQRIDPEQSLIEMETLAGEGTLSLELADAWHGDKVLTTIATEAPAWPRSASRRSTSKAPGRSPGCRRWPRRARQCMEHDRRWRSQLALGLVKSGSVARVMLAGADQELELALPAGTFQVMVGAGNR